jgi:hypothetical protein
MANITCGGCNAVMETMSVTVADQRDIRITAGEQETMMKRAARLQKTNGGYVYVNIILKMLECVRAA